MALSNYYALLFLIVITIACGETTPQITQEETPFVDEATVSRQITPDTIAVIDTLTLDTTPQPQKIERPSRKPAEMKFVKTTYSYDTIQQGEVVEYSFKFKNVGELPLTIKDVKGSCGCTIGSYPFLDVAPNEENAIKARFDSKGKEGAQTTTVTVYSNAVEKEMVLTLKGFVKK